MAPGQPADLLSREDSDWPHTGKHPPVPAGIRGSELLRTLHGPPSSRATAPQSTALPPNPSGAGGRQGCCSPCRASAGPAASRAPLTAPSLKLLFPFYFTFKGKPHGGKKPWEIVPFACHLLAIFCICLKWGQSIIFSTAKTTCYGKGGQNNHCQSHLSTSGHL